MLLQDLVILASFYNAETGETVVLAKRRGTLAYLLTIQAQSI
jgi:hypothetical protein